MRTLLVVGAGPGLGTAVALRFAREGYAVGLISRTAASVADALRHLRADGATVYSTQADVTDERALRTALDRTVEELGTPACAVYNAALIRPDELGALTAAGLHQAFGVNVVGAAITADHLGATMVAHAPSSLLMSGGMPAPVAAYTSLSIGKSALRTLAAVIDEQYGPQGLHAATVTICGPIAAGSRFDPTEIADHYWALHNQERDQWALELVYEGPDDITLRRPEQGP
ncbi:MAG TPA: SDR family NAD(P)-dependent oxidoreductase [Pseudonocardia sp.]